MTGVQLSLFGDLMEQEDREAADLGMKMPDIENFSRDAILEMEKEMLGVYVSGHPLDAYADRLRAVSTVNTETLNGGGQGLNDGDQVVMGAMIRSRRLLCSFYQHTICRMSSSAYCAQSIICYRRSFVHNKSFVI